MLIRKGLLLLLWLVINDYNSLGQEFVVIHDTVRWDMNSLHGFNFYTDDYIQTLPQNWNSPYNYEKGTFFLRFKILEVASQRPFGLQFGIWQWRTNPPDDEKEYTEKMSPIIHVSGMDTTIFHSSNPDRWWESFEGVNFERVDNFWRLGINIWSTDPRSVISPPAWGGNAEVWEERSDWFPIKAVATVVAVSENSEFSGWEYYDSVLEHPTIYGNKLIRQSISPRIYPNPSRGIINLIDPEAAILKVNVYSLTGILIYSKTIHIQRPNNQINLSDLPSGNYFLNIVTNKNDRYTDKIYLISQ